MRAEDQAEGLRRLFGRRATRVAVVISCRPRVGRTTFIVNLAAALGRNGRQVLVLDENRGMGNVADACGLRPRYELAHALNGDRALADTLVQGPGGVTILPAAQGLRLLEAPGRLADDALTGLAGVLAAADVVFVDTAADGASLTLPLAARRETILATASGTDDVTGTYACIKQLATRDPDPKVSIAVCGARYEAGALTAIGNLADVARRHLGVRVASLGVLSRDVLFAQAARAGKTVPEAFHRSRAAMQLNSIAARFEAGGREVTPVRHTAALTGAQA